MSDLIPEQDTLVPAASASSPLIGIHDTGGGAFLVRFLAEGPGGGPQYEIVLPSGARVTVVDDATVQAYLDAASSG